MALAPPDWPRRGWRDEVTIRLTDPRVLRPAFAVLRRCAPIVNVGRRTVVSRHADVVDVLERDVDFTVAQVNAERMGRWSGAFILGTDRGEVYDREVAALRRATPPGDLETVRSFVTARASALIDATRPAGRIDGGRIDVVNGYARLVAAGVVGTYLGAPGPDRATTMRWMRALFDGVFLDDSPRARRAAERTIAEQQPYMQELIARRRTEVAAGEPVPDDVLTRLVAMGDDEPWLDDDAVRRNVNGLIVGALDTTSKAVALVVDELLRRPEALAAAGRSARAGDVAAVQGYAWEALRFHPHGAILQRHCPREAALGPRPTTVKAGGTVMVSTLSAMFDPAAFPEPRRFRPDRPIDRYLHFGHGMHVCFGARINGVQVPELVAALLRLPGLRRAPGREGRMVLDGPFPDRLLVDFDREDRS